MKNAFGRLLHVFARPIRERPDKFAIQPFRGFGSENRVFVRGRVLRQPYFGIGVQNDTMERDIADVLRRFFRRGASDVVIDAWFAGTTKRVRTDRDGFFEIDMSYDAPAPDNGTWHSMRLSLADDSGTVTTANADVFIPPATAKFVVISDIDDTVVFTGVANKIGMMWRLFVKGAKSRVAFPGVAALYASLHSGASGKDCNPMLYVSRGPWSLYEVLDTFFNHHGIPNGPILFLRHWGLTLQSPLPRRARNHKRDLIRKMLSIYDERPFVLIGDSGQHDPEIYCEIVQENPGRVHSVYIRDVSRDRARAAAIEELGKILAREGSALVLAPDSFAMAQHAAAHGLIPDSALSDVLSEKEEQLADAA